MIRHFERLLFAYRRIVLAAFAVVTIVLGVLAADLRIDAGFTKLVPVEHEYMQTFLQYRDEFSGADGVVIAVMAKDGDMFTPEFIATLDEVTDATFFLPGVDRAQVFSILTPNVRFIEVVEDGIAAGNVLPDDFEPTEAGLSRLRENIIKAGIVGRLVANDFSGALVSARLQEFNPNTGERLDYLEVAQHLEQIRQEAQEGPNGNLDVDVHIIGFAKLVGDISDGAAQVVGFLRNCIPDHGTVRLRLHPFGTIDVCAPCLLTRCCHMATGRGYRTWFRRRPDVDSRSIPRVCDWRQPWCPDGEFRSNGGCQWCERAGCRAIKRSPTVASRHGCTRFGFRWVHHNLADRSSGDQGDSDYGQSGRRSDNPDESGTAACHAFLFRLG